MDKVTKSILSFSSNIQYIGFGAQINSLSIIGKELHTNIKLNINKLFKINENYIHIFVFGRYSNLVIATCRKCNKKHINTINYKTKRVRCHNCRKCERGTLLLNNFAEYFGE